MRLLEWLDWRWFCFCYGVCPKHRTKKIGDCEFSWCETCEGEKREKRRAQRMADFRAHGIDPDFKDTLVDTIERLKRP